MKKRRGPRPWNDQQTSYAMRDKTLRSLGFPDYATYLASPMWEAIRRQVLAGAKNACRLCHAQATVVHHLGYGRDTLLGARHSALVPLCNSCHWRVEFDRDGRKRTLKESKRAYRKMWRVCPFRKRRHEPEGRPTIFDRVREEVIEEAVEALAGLLQKSGQPGGGDDKWNSAIFMGIEVIESLRP